MKKAIVLFSGGLDSTTCLAMAIDKYGKDNVIALSVYYGQRHKREIESAKNVVDYYKVKHISYDLREIFKDSKCSLLEMSNEDIPEESYEGQLKKTEGKPVTTYVPFRNGLFLSVATTLALIHDCQVIYYGAHKDDSAGNAYPDCSEEFNENIGKAIYEGTGRQVKLYAPFINKNKADVVAKGLDLKVPYELTWSCYEGGEEPCGKCGTCIDRQKAFEKNGVDDPLWRRLKTHRT